MTKKQSMHLIGYATAQAPLMHVDSSDGMKTYNIKTTVQYKDDDGQIQMNEVPYVQGSSFRGVLRDVMATILARKVEAAGEMLDLTTAMRLFSGGQMEAGGNLTLEKRHDILTRCPDLELFGGSDQGMFASAIRVGHLYPIVDSTLRAGMVPEYLEKEKQEEFITRNDKTHNALNCWVMQRREDKVLDGGKTIQYLSEEGLKDAEAYIQKGLEAQGEKAEARKKGVDTDVKKTIQKHYGIIQVIPAGTKLFSEIMTTECSPQAIGLALVTLQEFLKMPFLCSASRSGYGKVSLSYDLRLDNGKVIKDFISPQKDGAHHIKLDAWGQESVDAFNAWTKDNMTAKSLRVE